jgi:hypothetical protein
MGDCDITCTCTHEYRYTGFYGGLNIVTIPMATCNEH